MNIDFDSNTYTKALHGCARLMSKCHFSAHCVIDLITVLNEKVRDKTL